MLRDRALYEAKQSITFVRDTILAKIESTHLRTKLFESIKGRDVFVLGSAPHAEAHLMLPNSVVFCANGSAKRAIELKLPTPLVTVVDNELLDPRARANKLERSEIVDRGLLHGIELGTLVSVQSNHSKGGDPSALGANYTNFVQIGRWTRRKIIAESCKNSLFDSSLNALVSTGCFTIALAAWLGARTVTFSGFSVWVKGNGTFHFYDLEEEPVLAKDDVRYHTMADLAAIACMNMGGSTVRTADRDFFPVTTNWGCIPPPWAK